MEHAKIAIIEDNITVAAHLTDFIDNHTEHEVVARAHTLEEALQLVSDVAEEKIDVDAITLDGNLKRGHTDCNDGRRVVETMKSLGLTTRIIGLSGFALKVRYIDVDVDVMKGDISGLLEALDNL